MAFRDYTTDVAAKAPEDAPKGAPEVMVINGVTYQREADWVDEQVNRINDLRAIAKRTGVSLRVAYFIIYSTVLPD